MMERSSFWSKLDQQRTSLTLVLALLLVWSACTPAMPENGISATTFTRRARIMAQGTTYYVRTDGGSPEQCTGLVDAPYSGGGTDQDCAWDHPFRALPPGGSLRIASGDTLIIGAGDYMMGYGAPGADNPDVCDPEGAYECHMPPVPSGPDPTNPTRILGAGWDTGCTSPPELWGTERPWYILNLTDSSNVEIACLEITDRSDCVEDHADPSLACERDTYPFGDWAAVGLYAEDSSNVHLRDLNIHGLASTGIHAGRLTDWTVEDVRIVGNGWVGWDGDLWDDDDSNSGTLLFRGWTVEWNGCGETYPGGEPTGCWAQTAGGYGDGVGTGGTGGDWIIEDSTFLHNTSDGLDLLYHQEGGSITLNRVRAEGNAGNQIKVTGQTAITNSVLVGNCAFFEGKPFTYDVDPCRALGNTLAVAYTGGEHVSIVNSTFYGQGDGLVGGGAREGYNCTGTETLAGRNNVFVGDDDFFTPEDISFLFYQEGCSDLKLDSDYNITHNAKNITCGTSDTYVNSGPNDLCQNPQLSGPFSGNTYGMIPTLGSPAIDAGDDVICPATDYRGVARPVDGNDDGVASCDMGAYERWQPVAWVYLPLVLKSYSQTPPQVAECAVFPADNVWNAPVDTLPVDANSDAYVATIGAADYVHADFGSGTWDGGPIGIPCVGVPGTQPEVAVTFYYDDESDPGPYPIPPDAPIEGGPDSDGDRHVLVVNRDNCTLYELFYAFPQPDGSWHADSGAVFDLNANALRPESWTSADAAGLPILPGLVRYDEVVEGEIRHALRFTAPQTRRAYIWPARHYASQLTGEQYPPMGQRFRLRADFDISGFSPEVQVILRALKTYGMILADNGAAWFISGVPDERWDNDVLHELHQISGSVFEAVDVSSLMVDPDSGQVQSP